MDVDEEEDVVFENSPLYHHLHDVGFVDHDLELVKPSTTSMPAMPKYAFEKNKSLWQCLVHALSLSTAMTWYTEAISVQEADYSAMIVDMIATSPALLEEDSAFLQNFSFSTTSTDKATNPGKEVNPPKSTDWSIIAAANLFVAVAAYLLTRFAADLTSFTNWLYVMDGLACFIIAVYVIPVFVITLRLWRRKSMWVRFVRLLQLYLTRSSEVLLCLKKSVLFVQELEVISRGFTMVSALSPVSRLESSDGTSTRRQCPQLRQIVFGLARELMLLHRRATANLVDKYPLQPEVDNINNYICNLSLDEYGPCLTVSIEDEDADYLLEEATDNFSLPALKAICRLCRLQYSEHIRRLALMHISNLRLPSNKHIYDATFSLKPGLTRLYKIVDVGANSISRAYDFHRYSCTETRRTHTPDVSTCKTDISQSEKGVFTAVHSLELHLLSCWKRSRDLSDHIEKQRRKGSSIGDYEQLMTEINLVRQELESCASCLDEGELQLVRLFGRNKPKNEVPKFGDLPLPKSNGQSPIDIFAMGEPIVQDQVFEAYSDPKEHDRGDCSWDEFVTPEEKAIHKREKAEAKRLLLELKSVIDIKAREREKREKIALKRMAGKSSTSDTDPELSDTENSMDPHSSNCDRLESMDKARADNVQNMGLKTAENTDKDPDFNCDDSKRINSRNKEDIIDGDANITATLKLNDNVDNDHDIVKRDVSREIEDKLERLCGVDMTFTSSLANQVAARSRSLGLTQDFFDDEGEKSDSDDIDSDRDCLKES